MTPRETFVFTVVPAPYPEPQCFVWFPLAGQRHAIDRRDRNVPLGSPMHSLCGVSHPRGPDGDMEWLWPTCQPCWDETCKIVGIRPRR
ncbi:MAG: zinc finger protein [Pseudonocardiales bacterium]